MLKKHLDNELHRRPDIAKAIQEKILFNEKQRKDINNIKKVSREVLKKASLHNKKLRDCKIHFNTNHERRLQKETLRAVALLKLVMLIFKQSLA